MTGSDSRTFPLAPRTLPARVGAAGGRRGWPGGGRRRVADRAWQAWSVDDLDILVPAWLTIPEVAERLGIDVTRVRRLVQDRYLLAVRRGERNVLSIPEALLDGDGPVQNLRGTITVLDDSGFGDEEALRWLFTSDDSLPGTPIEALRAGRKTEIRRRAQSLAF